MKGTPEAWTGLGPGQRPFREAAWFYAEYRYRPTEAFVRLLAAHLGWSASDRVLDLGAGPAHVSLRLAPFVGEVVVMDPEAAMIDEGRRRATSAGADNLSFVVAGSDNLTRLAGDLGRFAAVVISQAFHWMADQDAVLRALDPLLDPERGSVALVGYLKDPDYDRAWLDRPPWDTVEAILRRHLVEVPEGPDPAGRHDPFPDILARSAFSRVEQLAYEYEAVIQPSIEAAVGFEYSLGNLLDRLGEAPGRVRVGRASRTRQRRHLTPHDPPYRQRPDRPQTGWSRPITGDIPGCWRMTRFPSPRRVACVS